MNMDADPQAMILARRLEFVKWASTEWQRHGRRPRQAA
jgi:hypothetical protein